MVLWVGGEARYFRQNILNLSIDLGLDVSADAEKERGRIRSFDEQESESFKRVKRELFREVPYLLIIDNLETEKEWWEGKDLHDLIPRNTGGSHVIITTRLRRVMNFDPMQLQPLPFSDAMVLIRGRRKKEYSAGESEFLRKFDEKLGRSSFGLGVIGSLLSELEISPSDLFESINQIPVEEGFSLGINDEQFCISNPFLIKVLSFCIAILQQTNEKRNLLALRMLLVGAWFASAPISSNILATAAESMPANVNRFKKCTECFRFALCCFSGFLATQRWRSEEESVLVLAELGLARRATRQQNQNGFSSEDQILPPPTAASPPPPTEPIQSLSPSPSPSAATAPALVLSNSGKRIDQTGNKKYVKQVTSRHSDTELHLAAQRGDLSEILGDIDSQMVGTLLSLSSCDLYGVFLQMILQLPSLHAIDVSNSRLLEGSLPEFPKNVSLENLVHSYT